MNITKAMVRNIVKNGVSGKGNIYCIYDNFRKMFKIGCAKCVAHRVKILETASPDAFVVVATLDNVPNYRMVESIIMGMLHKNRMIARDGRRTEWFNASEVDIIEAFEYVAKALALKNAISIHNALANDLIVKKPRTSCNIPKTVISSKTKKELVFFTYGEIADYFGCSVQTVYLNRKYNTPFNGEYYICA